MDVREFYAALASVCDEGKCPRCGARIFCYTAPRSMTDGIISQALADAMQARQEDGEPILLDARTLRKVAEQAIRDSRASSQALCRETQKEEQRPSVECPQPSSEKNRKLDSVHGHVPFDHFFLADVGEEIIKTRDFEHEITSFRRDYSTNRKEVTTWT